MQESEVIKMFIRRIRARRHELRYENKYQQIASAAEKQV